MSANSEFSKAAGTHVLFTIAGAPYRVLSMTGTEKVSELYRFELVLADTAFGAPPALLIGKSAEIILADAFGILSRSIQGVVAEAFRTVTEAGTAKVKVVVRPNAYPLTLSRDSRAFTELNVPDIVERVLEKMGDKVPYRWELAESYSKRAYTAQYREPDWSFVSRLLEDSGIYYWFDHDEQKSVLVFGDDSPNAPRIVGGTLIEFLVDSGMKADKELILELASEAHATPTKFTVGSFDPWNPALKVQGQKGDGPHEIYDAPGGGSKSPAVCDKKAQLGLERAKSHRLTVSGNANSVRIEPGRILDIFNHLTLDGSYFVTEVTYACEQNMQFAGTGGGYRCHFELIPKKNTFRPELVTTTPKQAGIQTGRVGGPGGEEIHTDERGRVRVQLHWDREGAWDDKSGRWMRVAQRGVSNSMTFPRTGWNVATFMEEGNVDSPSVLARLHDAEHPPTYSLPENKTRTVFRTETTPSGGSANELRFEDLKGIQEFFMNASRDMNFVVKEAHSTGVVHDHTRQVGGNETVTIAAARDHQVDNDQVVTVKGNEKLTIMLNRTKTVEGDEREEITGNRKVEVGSHASHGVTQSRKLTVDGATIEEAREGLVKIAAAKAKVTVHGSLVHELDGQHHEEFTADSNKKVGANKTESCEKGYAVEVNDTVTETLKGNLQEKSDANYLDGAEESMEWKVGAALDASTPELVIEAKKRIVVMVGESRVEIGPKNIRITAPRYALDKSASLVSVTKQIRRN
ncbi:MAG: type VI secretion system tip protein VgrG [Myxococcales bacterium]|nr:type VI secretion system tip protein VgrG [Myxococcales bacterium]